MSWGVNTSRRWDESGRDLMPRRMQNCIALLIPCNRFNGVISTNPRRHQTSDDAVEEAIVANDYTFTEAGERFG